MKKKKGGISTVFVCMIGLAIMTYGFVQYTCHNITLIKYETISQYVRDSLLILETQGQITPTYLKDTKTSLSSKLDIKSSLGENFKMYVKYGNNNYIEVSNLSTTLVPDFGDDITIKATLNYLEKSISYNNEFLKPTTTKSLQTMEIELSSLSKNRRTSDG